MDDNRQISSGRDGIVNSCQWCDNEAQWNVSLSVDRSGNGVLVAGLCDGCLDTRTGG